VGSRYAVDLEKDSVAVLAADFLFSRSIGFASSHEPDRRIEVYGLRHCSFGFS
jgi:hypothetical protein